jgi:DNA-binding HxlR family transcriptional regulator
MIMNIREKKISAVQPLNDMVAQVVGCKWSLGVIACVRKGVVRPGAIERAMAGLTAKVLNDSLRKLLRFGVLERDVFPELPPRVEYRLTDFGERFCRVLDEIGKLEAELSMLPGIANEIRAGVPRRRAQSAR